VELELALAAAAGKAKCKASSSAGGTTNDFIFHLSSSADTIGRTTGQTGLGDDVIFAIMPSFLRRQHDLLFISEVAEARCSVAKQRRALAGSMFAAIWVLSRNG
jgi:hypothetical protein